MNRILLVEDNAGFNEALTETLLDFGYQVVSVFSAEDAQSALESSVFNLILSDVQMTGMGGFGLLNFVRENYKEVPVILMTAFGTIEKAVEAIKVGAVDYMVKPFDSEVLISNVEKYVSTLPTSGAEMVIEDSSSKDLWKKALKVAPTDAPVFISGESGVGKEVWAHSIHENSSFSSGPFIAVNCAAIPENMLEATLFGYEKGAFTGAYKSFPGKFEQAQKGTIFLDEITEMSYDLQSKLLRVLQEMEVERLGSRDVIPLSLRVLSASNRDIKTAIAEGLFREDLYYRLNVFPLSIKPLSERKDDIIPLSERFAFNFSKGESVVFSAEAKSALISHPWAGNIRELRNVIQRSVILAESNEISVKDLIFDDINVDSSKMPLVESSLEIESLDDLARLEYQLIQKILNKHQGNRKLAAEELGYSPRTLQYRLKVMKESGIDIA